MMDDKTFKAKVGIIGLGPVGMILAVKLKEAGCDVALCDKDDFKTKKIRSEGIFLENIINASATFDKVHDSPAEMAQYDLDYLIFSLKSYQTTSAAEEAEILNTDKISIISAQNGIDVEEMLFPVFGEPKCMRMIINFAGNLIAPNRVKVTFVTPPNYIGSVDDSRAKQSEEFANILTAINFGTAHMSSFELTKRVWEKTILNASLSALCGLGRLTMSEAMLDEDTFVLVEQIINEGVEVAEHEKIKFSDDFVRKCIRYLRKGGDHFPSLAVDIINNRQTEIDYFNGKIVEYGKKHYVKTALNLAFTNMVKAMTSKNIMARIPGVAGELNKKIVDKGLVDKRKSSNFYKETECYLGIDLGSAFTKFVVIDEKGHQLFRYTLQTLTKDRYAMKHVIQAIYANFNIKYSCATGYGRKHFTETDIVKTEINCAAAGVSYSFKGEKNIIDIGGEDIKIAQCDANNNVANFYMNDKCAAGTGAFLSEIAERAGINCAEMSSLAAHSEHEKELNSFCTVFAKTEIMNWVFDGLSNQDISRGVYISIANRVAKLKLHHGIPTYIIGGVIAHHPYLSNILSSKFNCQINSVENPQFTVALGAALLAMKNRHKEHPEEVSNLSA